MKRKNKMSCAIESADSAIVRFRSPNCRKLHTSLIFQYNGSFLPVVSTLRQRRQYIQAYSVSYDLNSVKFMENLVACIPHQYPGAHFSRNHKETCVQSNQKLSNFFPEGTATVSGLFSRNSRWELELYQPNNGLPRLVWKLKIAIDSDLDKIRMHCTLVLLMLFSRSLGVLQMNK